MTDMSDDAKSITVTAIIATYNRARYLQQALDSLLAQTEPPEEIIVVDDGSSDETQAVLARYAGAVRATSQSNAGKPVSLNRALPQAKGSHIWLFDDDDVALPGALAAHKRFLRAHPDIDFSCGRNYVFDGTGDIWQKDRWRPGVRADFSADTLLIELMRQCNVVFQGLLVPHRCLKAVGYFDETLLRCEDYDMLLKLARRFRGADLNEMTFVWRNHAGDRGSATERHSDTERAYIFRKYERVIFRRAWTDFNLAEYLSGESAATPDEPLSEATRITALLERSDIMFKHDLPNEASQDFRAAILQMDELTNRSAETRRAVSAVALNAGDVADPVFVATAFVRARHLAASIPRGHRRNIAPAALKGFYWSWRRALRQNRRRDAIRMLMASGVFAFGLFSPRSN